MHIAAQQQNHGFQPNRRGTPVICRGFSAGFTLIEVLIAITIFAILLAAIDGLLFGAMHLQTKTLDLIDEALPIDRAITIIKRDITGIVPPNGRICGQITGGSAVGQNGTAVQGLPGVVNLEFYTTTGIISDDDEPSCDIQKIDYMLQNSTNRANPQGRVLVRCITRNPLSLTTIMPEQQRILENIQNLQIMFFDGTNWLDTWGSTGDYTATNVPTAIRFQIDFATDRSSRQAKSQMDLLFPIPTALINTNSL